MPVRCASAARVVAAYEIYQDAAAIDANIADTRRDVFLIAAAVAAILALPAVRGVRWDIPPAGPPEPAAPRTDRHAARQRGALPLARPERVGPRSRRSTTTAPSATRASPSNGSSAIRPTTASGRKLADARPPGRPRALARHLASLDRRPGADVDRRDTRGPHSDGRWRVFDWTARNLADDPAIGGFVINGARRHRAHRARGPAPPPGLPRSADRARQPGALRRPRRALPRPAPPQPRDAGGAVPRPRRLQDRQRHARSRHGRPAARRGLATAGRVHPTRRHGLPPVGRRVRDPARGGRRRRRGHRGRRARSCHGSPSRWTSDATCRSRPASASRWSTTSVDDADDVLARADVAMYAAKTAGKGRHQLYEPAMRDRAWTPSRTRGRAAARDRSGRDRRRLPADPRSARRASRSRWRRSSAGTTPSAAACCRRTSSPSPRRAA